MRLSPQSLGFARGDTMTAELRSWWQRIKQHPVRSAVSIGAGLLGIALLVAFIGGYFFNWDWTGFSSYTPPVKDSNFQRGKTLWDWLNLLGVLAIPAVVGLGAAWYTAQQGKVSDRENTDNQRETALQAYIDKMSELLLDKQLWKSQPEDEKEIIHLREPAPQNLILMYPNLKKTDPFGPALQKAGESRDNPGKTNR